MDTSNIFKFRNRGTQTTNPKNRLQGNVLHVQGSTVCVFVLRDHRSPTASIFSNGFYWPKYTTFVQLFILPRLQRHHPLFTANLNVLHSITAYTPNHPIVMDVALRFAPPKMQENKLSSTWYAVIGTIFDEYANADSSGVALLFIRNCLLNEVWSEILRAIFVGTICVPSRRNRPTHRTAN
jgi:hypothetical protein